MASDLKWEQMEIQVAADPSDKKAEADFSFTNGTSHPIELGKIHTSCGCTTAEVSKKIYQPGESGVVHVTFNMSGRKGIQEKLIIVETESPTPDVLKLRVEIPDSVKVDKKMLVWHVNDLPEPQSFEITIPHPQVTRITGVKGVEAKFEASLEEIENGKNYRLKVVPATTKEIMRGTIRLEIEDPEKRNIFLRVEVKKI